MNTLNELRADWIETRRSLGRHIADIKAGTKIHPIDQDSTKATAEFKADPDLPTHEPALRQDRPVILYCGSGGRAALAGKTLLDLGFKDVRNVGGFKNLVEAGWAVEPG